jgi:hypothetical protein
MSVPRRKQPCRIGYSGSIRHSLLVGLDGIMYGGRRRLLSVWGCVLLEARQLAVDRQCIQEHELRAVLVQKGCPDFDPAVLFAVVSAGDDRIDVATGCRHGGYKLVRGKVTFDYIENAITLSTW